MMSLLCLSFTELNAAERKTTVLFSRLDNIFQDDCVTRGLISKTLHIILTKSKCKKQVNKKVYLSKEIFRLLITISNFFNHQLADDMLLGLQSPFNDTFLWWMEVKNHLTHTQRKTIPI